MKKNIPLFLMSFLFLMANNVQAQEWGTEDSCCYEDNYCICENNFYVRVLGGANFLQNTKITDNKSSYETGYVIAGSLGYCWNYGLRLEAEYAFRRNAIEKICFFTEGFSRHGHYQSSSYMANLLWDFPLLSCGCSFRNIQPFIGAGIGYDRQSMKSSNSRIVFNQKWNHFSWQLIAGLACPIYSNTEITVEYTFHQGGCHFNNHSIGAALVYKFGCFR